MSNKIYDCLIVGGGQAGLSIGYFLRRYKLDYLILDNQEKAGGSWLQTWDELRLFSPTTYSSLSGWMMPQGADEYPSKDEFLAYLEAYEARYKFPIQRNTEVSGVSKEGELFKVETNQGTYLTRAVISATGTARNPFIPAYPGNDQYRGLQIHSVDYRNNELFKDLNVIIVGGGNSGAQILAEVSKVAETTWVTIDPPAFLPDDIDGRYLFHAATQKYLGKTEEGTEKPRHSLANIVMVESVREARERNVLHAVRPFKSFNEQGVIWEDGSQSEVHAVIWCTGFKSNLSHLSPLSLEQNGRIKTLGTRSVAEPGLWLVGYGNWTGYASATIYGVGKTARETVKELVDYLN